MKKWYVLSQFVVVFITGLLIFKNQNLSEIWLLQVFLLLAFIASHIVLKYYLWEIESDALKSGWNNLANKISFEVDQRLIPIEGEVKFNFSGEIYYNNGKRTKICLIKNTTKKE